MRPRPRAWLPAAPPWVSAWWRSPARPIPIVLAVAAIVALQRSHADPRAPSPEAALAEALTARGLTVDPSDVDWIRGPRGVWGAFVGGSRALVRAHVGDEPSDIYLVDARLSPEGAVLDAGPAWNVTSTAGADESRPVVRHGVAVYTTTTEGLCTGLHVLDLTGAPPAEWDGFTRTQRLQTALTNLQHTGQIDGVVHDTFALDPVARQASFRWRDDGEIELHADDRVVTVDPLSKQVIGGGSFVHTLLDERARPGNVVTWAVDRVRAMPWFGDDRMQWLKAVVFTALDQWRARFARGSTAEDVADELGLSRERASAPAYADPETGWPPPPIKTVATPTLPGEGRWIPLDDDPFITRTPSGRAPAFVTSFVRPDPHRLDVRVYVTLWDPRQVALHMEAGSVEPIGANGEHGPGLVPRTPEVMTRFVAAFNGGFQAQHGEFGMQAGGVEYLPPKPYAATVVEERDGSIGFGAWPGPGSADPEIGADIVSFRQNLTALVQDGRYNPWGRTWWGGTPPGWPDQVHSTRSALCLTREGFVGYFYSASISAEDLAMAMLDARCTFGIHLDMNPGHAGFEFYRVARDTPGPGGMPALGRPLQPDWEAEGKVPGMPGFVFRSRRMIRGMGHMLFPRYIQREARDFFYLTARPLLPGAPVSVPAGSPDPDEGVWRTSGLPQHGFPYALATTWVRADDTKPRGGPKLLVLRADPKTMQPATASTVDDPTILSFAGGLRGARVLSWQGGVFAEGDAVPPGAYALVAGVDPSSPLAANARAGAGVDADGMLVWAEVAPESAPGEVAAAALDKLLARLGCQRRMLIPGDAHALPGGSLDVTGAAAPPQTTPIASRLVRAHAPGAHPIFEHTPIVPSSVWQPLQAKRVRYFYKPAGAASSSNPVSGTTARVKQ